LSNLPLAVFACGKLVFLYIMTNYIRQGECNLCGQCCGAEGSPNQDNPWPNSWPESIRNRSYEQIKETWPQVQLIDWGKKYGSHKIQNEKINWIWIKRESLCKDLLPYGDETTYSLECPWLAGKDGDEQRPCSLVGTEFEDYWWTACQHQPPMEKTVEQVDEWKIRHPLCSYEWVEKE
jgi:hypothetical protein